MSQWGEEGNSVLFHGLDNCWSLWIILAEWKEQFKFFLSLFSYFCTFSFCYDFSIRIDSLLCSTRRWPRLLYTLSNIAQFIWGTVPGLSVKFLKCECEIATGINAPSGWLFWQAPGVDANKWDFHFIRWIFLSFLAVVPWKRTSHTAASLTVADVVNYFFPLLY